MAKAKNPPSAVAPIAGLLPVQWKHHMDTDEDWTERLENVGEAGVGEVIAALDHGDAEIRALACSLAYAIGVAGLGAHAARTVARVAELADGDPKPKVRNRARTVHEGLAGEMQRVAIHRELPWLAGYTEAALPHATAALDDPRAAVRLQVYLWWINAAAVPADTRKIVADKLAALIDRETDAIARRAAQLACAQLRGA